MLTPRRFILSFTAGAAIVLLLIAVGNVVFDAAGVFHFTSPKFQAYVRSYAARLPHAEYGLKYPPYERAIKIAIAEASQAPCYVTGSSRHMQVGRDVIPGLAESCGSVTNLAVSGGTFEDLLIFMAILVENPAARRVYVGVDPWSLFRHRGAGWVDFADRYYAARQKFGIDPLTTFSQTDHVFRNIGHAISLDYLVKSVKAYLSGGGNVADLHLVEYASQDQQFNSGSNALLPDGTLLYPGVYLAKTPPPDHLIGPGTFNLTAKPVDQAVIAEIDELIRETRKRNIEFSFVLVPYHPKVFQCERQWVCQAILEAEIQIRIIAAKHGIEVIGSYDPGKMMVSREDYLDDIHVSGTSILQALTPARR